MAYGFGDKANGRISGSSVSLPARPGAVDPKAQQIDIFPLDAWEFDDPKTHSVPRMRLRAPWVFHGGSIEVGSIGAEQINVSALFAEEITVPAGGAIRYETGSGVQKRCVQLADEKIDWLDTPDTSPASPERLRARIGRLGVGGSILLDGEFLAPISSKSPSEELIYNAGDEYGVIFQRLFELSDGTQYAVWLDYDDYNVEISRKIAGSSWEAPVVFSYEEAIIEAAFTQVSDVNFVVLFTFQKVGSTRRGLGVVQVSGVTFGTPYVLIAPEVSSTDLGRLELFPDGASLFCAYADSGNVIVRKIDLPGTIGYPLTVASGASLGWIATIGSVVSQGSSKSLARIVFDADSKRYEQLLLPVIGESNEVASYSLYGSAYEVPLPSYVYNYILELDGTLKLCYYSTADRKIYTLRYNGTAYDAQVELCTLPLLLGEGHSFPRAFLLNSGNIGIITADSYLNSRAVLYTLQRYARVGAGIIESGYVSGRGWYVKYGDGTMEQRYSAQRGTSGYQTWTFPTPFIDTNITVHVTSNNSEVESIAGNAGVPTAASCRWNCTRTDTGGYPTTTGLVALGATGRWKA